ncbi:MAG: hypothetical protein M3R01_06385, partial [Actinomycetota bacterium]|nr:hypothetical protein [Actinomycetota bacterium]
TILYRPDLVVATTLGVGAALWGVERLRLRRFAVGAALGLAPYLIHLATAGVGNSVQGMLLDPVFRLRGGRSLPIPPSPSELVGFLQLSGETYLFEWPLPTLTTAQQIALWFWLVFVINAVLVGVGVWRVRTDRRSVTARIVLAVALFGLGMLPQAVQRTDSTHFAWATAVGLGFLPVAVAELLGRFAPRRRPALRSLVAGGLVLLLLAVAIPNFTFLRYADLTAQTFGSHRLSFPVSREGRNFYYGRRDAAKALRTLLPDLERVAAPGDRLFVGTSDLRKTPYSDAFLYHLFPELDPATRYIEMDPGVANEEGSGLAEDLASADVAVLSRIWNDWNEPNDSRVVGSDESNRVLEDQFRLERAYGGTDTGPGQSFASAANRDRFNVLFELWVRREPRSGG